MRDADQTDYLANGDAVDQHPELVVALREYQAAVDAGVTPDRQKLLARYPNVANDLEECLDGLDVLQAAAPALQADPIQAAPMSVAAEGTLGDFRLIREVGRGGMGVVYEALQISLDRRVALKVLPFAATFDSRQLQRFKNEAHAAALLHHTHIVPIYAVGSERGVHFYAMQFIEGDSLATVVRQLRDRAGREPGLAADESAGRSSGGASKLHGDEGKPDVALSGRLADDGGRSTWDVSAALTSAASSSTAIDFRKVARLAIHAAEALEHAHQRGVVHRDVKPANILVDAAGDLWVTDFGLAQLQMDTGLTKPGDLLGTIRYMSPEQASGRKTLLDHRTDIYSLGATLYELLTLEPPFAGETRQELLYQILHQEPRSPRLVNRAVPVELETIVLKCLAKNPAERYAAAADLAADLQRFLDHQPIQARRPSLVDRARKWSRRHPSAVVAAVLLLIVVAIALSISNRLISQEQQKTVAALARESKRADEEKMRANQAETQLRQSRQAVDILIQISEKELANEPIPRFWRLLLLETALGYYQSFIDYQSAIERRNQDSAPQPELSAIQARIGRTLSDLTALKDESNILQVQVVMILLWSPPLLDEFGLSAPQRELVADLRQKWSDDYRATCEDSRGAPEDARRQRLVRVAEGYERALRAVLSNEQMERVEQLGLQSAVKFGYNGPDFVKALKLPAGPRVSSGGLKFPAFSRMTDPLGLPTQQSGEVLSSTLEDALLDAVTTLTKDWRKSAGALFEGFRERANSAPAAPEPDHLPD
ncbi:MAG: serine/threonine-protein kinase [Planctomycetaceae bacterium]